MQIFKSKTFWTAVTGIVGAGAAVATGAATPAEGGIAAMNGLMAIMMRLAIAKVGGPAAAAADAADEAK